MKSARILQAVALLSMLGVTQAMADCQIADAKLEEAILQRPELRGKANRQTVRDLRNLRDAAITLWSYGRHDDCERLLGNIRELLAGPPINSLGGNDEEDADTQMSAREPKVQRGAVQGRRADKDAKPLINIEELAPGAGRPNHRRRGAQRRRQNRGRCPERRVRHEGPPRLCDRGVRRVLHPRQGQHRRSDPVPQGLAGAGQLLSSMPEAEVRTVPHMPDQDYKWLADDAWRTRTDALFAGRP